MSFRSIFKMFRSRGKKNTSKFLYRNQKPKSSALLREDAIRNRNGVPHRRNMLVPHYQYDQYDHLLFGLSSKKIKSTFTVHAIDNALVSMGATYNQAAMISHSIHGTVNRVAKKHPMKNLTEVIQKALIQITANNIIRYKLVSSRK